MKIQQVFVCCKIERFAQFFFYLVVETKNNIEKSWAKKVKLFEGFCDSSREKQMNHIVNDAVYISFYGSNEMERAQSKTLSVPYDTYTLHLDYDNILNILHRDIEEWRE